ncbi:MAG: HDIG domain-containing protein [Mangrovibacterium sp.]|nr:HDIG domain-containing protein [Mangrovibacterium sp.]
MKKLLTRLKRYYHFFYIALAFSASIFILYLVIPGETRFRYEFQKNAPWRHETLIAPFNFAILKPDEKVKQERDSIQKQFIPYYKKDTLTGIQQSRNFDLKLNQLREKISRLEPRVIDAMTGYLTQVYDSGIIDQSPDKHPLLKNKKELFVISGKTARKIPLQTIFSLKTAFQAMNDSLHRILEEDINRLNQHFNLSDYIQANLNYDPEFNTQEMAQLVNSVSVTQGMVQAGERIIFSGDLVTPEKYQVLESLKKSIETKQGQNIDRYLLLIGKLVLIVSCMLLLILYLAYFRPEIFNQKRHLTFILFLIILMVVISRFIVTHGLLNIYVIPIAILPILFRVFFDSRTAIYGLMVTCLLIGYFAPNNYEFIFLNLIAGIISVFTLYKLHRRSHLVFTSLWVLFTYSVLYLALSMVQEGNMESIRWQNLQWFAANALLLLLVYPLVYIFEKLFGFVSDVTLIELSNTNQPLLRKLAEDAPGTFQHSLQIANLAEAVIHRIGGNPFLAYAGALYHDIGKMNQPVYFVENQSDGMNPHTEMTYKESAKVIIDHVHAGVKLARRHKLPEVLISFITTHHGTTKAKFFYTLYKNEHPKEMIDPVEFSYPGPSPYNREASVVMLIDGIEAATRSLKEKTPANIRELINRMVSEKLDEGQLDDAELTMRDIRILKETLFEKLMNVYHVRIEYPKENNPRGAG